ncbi:YbfB/YjiJ family MFS transporter [Geobacter sp. AOG2]|uniref:YbfB/YjiJ family MFS transporter n=1 Tax=Geobacter sp. AOG2 TaxID=1566347 RepID=UPI001CC781A0|nr:YbfB/YjiJ family MFS transporter [Geobacter sp. AOG2]GFE61140.1 MFS transporter [Geobacter sp. AOG2]
MPSQQGKAARPGNGTTTPVVPFHYGWVIVAVGFLIIFACIGLARYAYTMLLPSMQAGLGLSYDRMGFIGTGNFCGYLLSVVLAPRLIRRFGPRVMICAGLMPITLALLAIGRSSGFIAPFALYLLAGVGTGFANIPTMVLINHWFRSDRRGTAAGLMIAGNGAAIMLAGFLIPYLNRVFGAEGWRAGWLVLGSVALVVSILAGWLVRSHPADVGLEPMGRSLPPSPEQLIPHERRGDGALLVRLGVLYLAFGATFMVYGTFIVTTMVREYGFSEAKAGHYWSWAGFFSFFSGVLFGALSDRIGRRYGLALVFAVQSAAYLLAGLKPGSVGLTISIVLYGLAVFAIPAIMAAAVGDYLGPSRAAGAFATITIFFAAGQTLGPALAGIIAKATGAFAGAYLLAALITAAASILALFLPRPVHA